MKQWLLFLFSRAFIRSLVRLGGVWLLILGGLWFYLKFYSRPDAIQTLPNLKGLHLVEAQEVLAALELEIIHLDSIYSRNGRPFEVVEQVPEPNSKIKSGRIIYVTTYRSTPPFEKVGIREGQDPGIARIILENKGFEVEEVLEPNIALVGRVIRIEDGQGMVLGSEQRLPKGSLLRLVSGTTTDERVGVPNLLGLNLREVRARLVKAKLSLGLVEYAESVEDEGDSLRAKVLEQHLIPTTQKSIAAGTEIDLYLGLRWDSGRQN
jgi:beta-lactam-binding protein with PASTA domain